MKSQFYFYCEFLLLSIIGSLSQKYRKLTEKIAVSLSDFTFRYVVALLFTCCIVSDINGQPCSGVTFDNGTSNAVGLPVGSGTVIPDMNTNFFTASPYTVPGSTGGAASLTINDGTEFCDENGTAMTTGTEEGPDLAIVINVPPENQLSCADGVLTICLRGDFNNACEVAFITDASGTVIAQSEVTGVSGEVACTTTTCLDVTIPSCALNEDAADGVLNFEIRTNGDVVSMPPASGDQVDDTCTGADGVDETGDENPDGNCITFESFVWPTTMPEIVCPDNVTIECTASTDPTETGEPTFVGDCVDDASFTFEDVVVEGDCPNESVITRTWTATICNDPEVPFFELTCDQIITIEDTTPPVITCPDNVAELICNTPLTMEMATATDNCSTDENITITSEDDGVPADLVCEGGVITRIFTADDGCGNMSMCMQTFDFLPADPPTITCPDDAIVACAADIVPGEATVVISCELGSTITNTDPELMTGEADCPGATYQIVYTVTDDCEGTAECTQTFTIANDDPTIECPADEIVACAADIAAGTPTVVVACELGSTITNTEPELMSGEADCPDATYQITYTVTDACGRTAECTQTFTIANDDPTITCPDDMIIVCPDDIMIGEASFMTSCELGGVVTTAGPTLTSGTDGIPGATYEIVYTVTDDCGRTAECTQVLTLQNDDPTISCPADAIVECAADIVIGEPQTSVSCDSEATVTTEGPTLASGTADCPDATYEIVYTVTDDIGRTAECTQTFTIANDDIECAADIVVGTPTITVSCELGSTITNTDPTLVSGDADCPDAMYEIVYTVTDDCGRTAECTQTFTIANDDLSHQAVC